MESAHQEPEHADVSRKRAAGPVSSGCRAGDDIRNSVVGPRPFDPKLLEVQSDVWAAFSQKRKVILMMKLN